MAMSVMPTFTSCQNLDFQMFKLILRKAFHQLFFGFVLSVETIKRPTQLQTLRMGISLNFETGFLHFETLPLILRHERVGKGKSHDYETGFLNYETSSQHFETDCRNRIFHAIYINKVSEMFVFGTPGLNVLFFIA